MNPVRKALSTIKRPFVKVETKVRKVSIFSPDEWGYQVAESEAHEISKATLENFLKCYHKLTWAFLGTSTIATAAAQVPFEVFRFTDATKNRKEPTWHPLLELLKYPNRKDTRFKLWWKTFSYLELVGNAFWFIERNERGVPVKIHVPRPDSVTVLPQKDGSARFKRSRANGRAAEIWADEDVVHFFMFNPLCDYLGLPTLAPGTDSLIIDLYLTKYDKAYYQNAERPGRYLKVPEGVEVSDPEFRRLKAELEEFHRGVEKFHKTAVFTGGAELKELRNPSHADTSFIEHKRITREEILSLLGCYHLVILLKESSNRAVLKEAYRMFWETTVLPRLQNVQESVEKELLPQFPGIDPAEFTCAFNTKKIRGLREELLDESRADVRYVQMGIKTINEVRAERDFGEDLPWGSKPPATAPFRIATSVYEENELKEILEPEERPKDLEEALEVQGER